MSRIGAVAGVVSLAVTVAGVRAGVAWTVAEVLVLLALTLVTVRRSPPAALLPALAVPAIVAGQVWGGSPQLVAGACAAWALPAVAAYGAGLYLRRLDADRRRAVAAAIQDQRLALARDLHDYVAHDVSGMLVQAQAAALTPGLPTQVRDALTRIEHGGQRALASLDRTVHVLHTDPPTPDLRELVRAFDLDVDLELDDLPREVAATAHRVVTEALTNVRRHATRATRVAVHVTRRDGDVLVRVEDDGGGHSDSGRRSGHGLAGLAGLLARDGGTLTAGPHENGWLVEAVIRT